MSEADQITISRRQTAREEADLAIHLLYTGGSLICANLLAWASIEVTNGVARHRGIATLTDLLTEKIRDDKRREWFSIVKQHYNFAKHADRDPELEVEINSDIVEFVVFEAVMNYREVYKQMTFPMLLHGTYMFAKFPEILHETGLSIAHAGHALLGEAPSISKVAKFYTAFVENKADVLASIPEQDREGIEFA